MFFSQDFRIGLSMLGKNINISNKGFLALLQDIAEMHSASIGFGVTDIDKTNYSWALLNWKVKIITRPKYGETITIKTWSRYSTKLFSYRDFEILNKDGEVIAIATSKWVLIDVAIGKIAKLEPELIAKYHPEDKSVFNILELDRLSEPETYSSVVNYKIRKADIDINNHVNNLCYLDMALEGFPGDSNEFNSCNEFEIYYKHQVRVTDDITLHYSNENGQNCIAIKSNNGEVLHSVVKFY
jgi:medium-chain acyl-[acyl-carrier-protein] hydrolase